MAWTSTHSAKTANLPRHNHDLGAWNSEKSPTCPRCIYNVQQSGIEIHTCDHKGAFGRKDMSCARCRQISEGVKLETPVGRAVESHQRKMRIEAVRSESIRHHYSSGECARTCGTCCVKFDW